MRRGKERERDVLAWLQAAGRYSSPSFEVVGGQTSITIKDRDGKPIIRGKYDGRLAFEDLRTSRPIFEYKAGKTFEYAETIDDLDRNPWSRHAVDQNLAYLLGEGEPLGLLVCDRPGLPNMIPIVLEEHFERAERFLREAREALDARDAFLDRLDPAVLPPFTLQRSVCRRCPHLGANCVPPEVEIGEGIHVVADERLLSLAEVVDSKADAAKEYESAWKEFRESLRGVERAIVGPFEWSGSWRSKSVVKAPDDVKAKAEALSSEASKLLDPFKVKEPKGSFVGSLRRVLPKDDSSSTSEAESR
jgi:hypothetical protein